MLRKFWSRQLTFWIVFGACLAEGSREVRHVFHLRLSIDSCRRHLLGLRRACLRDVSQWVWLRRQHGDQVSRLANQISPTLLLHAFLFAIPQSFFCLKGRRLTRWMEPRQAAPSATISKGWRRSCPQSTKVFLSQVVSFIHL